MSMTLHTVFGCRFRFRLAKISYVLLHFCSSSAPWLLMNGNMYNHLRELDRPFISCSRFWGFDSISRKYILLNFVRLFNFILYREFNCWDFLPLLIGYRFKVPEASNRSPSTFYVKHNVVWGERSEVSTCIDWDLGMHDQDVYDFLKISDSMKRWIYDLWGRWNAFDWWPNTLGLLRAYSAAVFEAGSLQI